MAAEWNRDGGEHKADSMPRSDYLADEHDVLFSPSPPAVLSSTVATERTEYSAPPDDGAAAFTAQDGTTPLRRSTSCEDDDDDDSEPESSWADDRTTSLSISQQQQRPSASRLRLSPFPAPTTTLEGLRFQSDLRQIGALLMVLGVGAYGSSLMLQAELIEGGMGTESIEGVKLAQLTATSLQTFMGVFAAAVGFVTLTVTPTGHTFHTVCKWLVFVINAVGPVGLIITIVRLVQGARVPPDHNHFIPISFGPTEGDVKFVAAMGIVGISSVCSTLIGGLTVVSLNLCAYLGRQPMDKNRGYYIVRFGYYNIIVLLGGLSQLALGVFLLLRYGGGFYDDCVHITVYTIFCPEMAIAAGVVQTVVPVYGWYRTIRFAKQRGQGKGGGGVRLDDHAFLYASALLWIVTTVLQVAAQPAYAVGTGKFTAEGATYSAVYLGTFLMPPYLDYLVRNTAVKVLPEYFGLSSTEVEEKIDPLSRFFGLTSEQMLVKKRLDSLGVF